MMNYVTSVTTWTGRWRGNGRRAGGRRMRSGIDEHGVARQPCSHNTGGASSPDLIELGQYAKTYPDWVRALGDAEFMGDA
jgi:hypothetical protein